MNIKKGEREGTVLKYTAMYFGIETTQGKGKGGCDHEKGREEGKDNNVYYTKANSNVHVLLAHKRIDWPSSSTEFPSHQHFL